MVYDIYMKVVRFIAEIYMNHTYGQSMNDFEGNLYEFLDWGSHLSISMSFAKGFVNNGIAIIVAIAFVWAVFQVIDCVRKTVKNIRERA